VFSVDGLESKHNEVRGRDTAWQTMVATLRALAPRRRELNLKIAVNQTYPLAEAAQAQRDLEARLTTGSTVLLA
jgi:NADPH:quinone reductase-like Zn-dependent oxidoreductase